VIDELAAFVKWEEAAHDQFSVMLKNEGVTIQELNKVGYNETYDRHLYGLKRYY
jgi:hypothetical protein